MDEPEEAPPVEGERVQKVLARAGLGSRRACDELVEAGRVTVNGEVAEPGSRVDPELDVVAVDGAPVGVRPGLVYYLLNKPAGVVTTASDPQGRPTVVEQVPSDPRVFPVGRLDAETEGLLLLTNDGDLAQRVAHPSHGVEKEYLAEIDGSPTRAELRRLREGIELDDGPTAPATVTSVAPGALRIAIHEGRNRQIRRMCAAVGHPVVRLIRVRIGPLSDRRLRPGQWRELTQDEVRTLERAAVERPKPRRPAKSGAKPGTKAGVKKAGAKPGAGSRSKPTEPGSAPNTRTGPRAEARSAARPKGKAESRGAPGTRSRSTPDESARSAGRGRARAESDGEAGAGSRSKSGNSGRTSASSGDRGARSGSKSGNSGEARVGDGAEPSSRGGARARPGPKSGTHGKRGMAGARAAARAAAAAKGVAGAESGDGSAGSGSKPGGEGDVPRS